MNPSIILLTSNTILKINGNREGVTTTKVLLNT